MGPILFNKLANYTIININSIYYIDTTFKNILKEFLLDTLIL